MLIPCFQARGSNATFQSSAGYCDPGEYYDGEGYYNQALLEGKLHTPVDFLRSRKEGDFSLAPTQSSRRRAGNERPPSSAISSAMTYASANSNYTQSASSSFYESPYDQGRPSASASSYQPSNSSYQPSSSRSRHHGSDDKGDRHGSGSSRSHRY